MNLASTGYLLLFLVIIVVVFILVLLLPAILELKKPKDAGPRKITEEDEEDS